VNNGVDVKNGVEPGHAGDHRCHIVRPCTDEQDIFRAAKRINAAVAVAAGLV
jgi:hypothetical protein